MNLSVNGNAYALLALAHAECTAELNLILKGILVDKPLKLLDNLSCSYKVAGASYAYGNPDC